MFVCSFLASFAFLRTGISSTISTSSYEWFSSMGRGRGWGAVGAFCIDPFMRGGLKGLLRPDADAKDFVTCYEKRRLEHGYSNRKWYHLVLEHRVQVASTFLCYLGHSLSRVDVLSYRMNAVLLFPEEVGRVQENYNSYFHHLCPSDAFAIDPLNVPFVHHHCLDEMEGPAV